MNIPVENYEETRLLDSSISCDLIFTLQYLKHLLHPSKSVHKALNTVSKLKSYKKGEVIYIYIYIQI